MVDGGAVVVHPRHQHGEHERVAGVQGQLGHAAVVDHGPPVGLAQVEEGGLRRDRQLLVEVAHRQLHVDGRGLAHLQPDAARVLLEARHLHRERIGARPEERDRVAPVRARGDRGQLTRLHVLDPHRGPGDSSPRGVRYASVDGGPEILGGGGQGQPRRECPAGQKPSSHVCPLLT